MRPYQNLSVEPMAVEDVSSDGSSGDLVLRVTFEVRMSSTTAEGAEVNRAEQNGTLTDLLDALARTVARRSAARSVWTASGATVSQ